MSYIINEQYGQNEIALDEVYSRGLHGRSRVVS